MKNISPTLKAALWLRALLVKADLRLLLVLVALTGLAAWLSPVVVLPFFLAIGLPIFMAALKLQAFPRSALAAYISFVIIWTVVQFVMTLTSQPGDLRLALLSAFTLGGKLTAVISLALTVPLAATPLAVGRAVSWYLVPVDKFFSRLRGRHDPSSHCAWRVSLCLCLMISFLPKITATMTEINRSLKLRAPKLSAYHRLRLMGLTTLRAVGSQTWDTAIAIASRDLYRPEPWIWDSFKSKK